MSKDVLRSIDPTLEEPNFKAAIIHIGINHMLYDSSSQQVKLLLQNISEIEKRCKNHESNYVFISSTTFNSRILHKLLNEINEMIEKLCLESSYRYMENEYVNKNDLFNDRVHLQNSGEKYCLKIPL